MGFKVLRWFHPMAGCDWHIPFPPPVGAPLPAPTPYGVVQIMGNPVSLTKLYTTDTFADSTQPAMCKGSDIGMLIPHIGTFSVVMAIEMLFSGSKCYFGPSAVQVTDNTGAPNNPAVAILVHVNLNLNCGTPFPTPTGAVIAFNTTELGMTWGDFFSGLLSMAFDWVFQTIINLLCLKYAGRFIGEPLRRLGGRLAARLGLGTLSRTASRQSARALWKAAGKPGPLSVFAREVAEAAARRNRLFVEGFGLVSENIVNFLLGSPIGTAVDAPGLGLPVPSAWGGLQKGMGAAWSWATGPSGAGSTPTSTPSSTPTSTPSSTPMSTPSSTPMSTPNSPEQNVCQPSDAANDYMNDPSVEDF